MSLELVKWFDVDEFIGIGRL